MRTTRLVLAALGVLAGVYGAWLLLERGWSNLVATGVWLAGGVVVHDFVFAPIVIVLVAMAMPWVPPAYRAVVAGCLLVLVTVTVVAIPVLGRFGARADNPTLLDRSYLLGWLGFAGVVVAAGLVAGLVVRRRGRAA